MSALTVLWHCILYLPHFSLLSPPHNTQYLCCLSVVHIQYIRTLPFLTFCQFPPLFSFLRHVQHPNPHPKKCNLYRNTFIAFACLEAAATKTVMLSSNQCFLSVLLLKLNLTGSEGRLHPQILGVEKQWSFCLTRLTTNFFCLCFFHWPLITSFSNIATACSLSCRESQKTLKGIKKTAL